MSLSSPKSVFALDSRLLAQVTHLTAPLTLLLSGNHRETVIFFVILLPHSQFLLGVLLLKSHNHHIDWFASRTLNVYCHSHCLHSAAPSCDPSTRATPEHTDLSSVPSDYHDLSDFLLRAMNETPWSPASKTHLLLDSLTPHPHQ